MGYGAGIQPGYGAGRGVGYGAGAPNRSGGYGAGYFASAVSSFLPSDIAGLQIWLKPEGPFWQDSARTTPVTADNDPIGAWDDASGNARHVTQATAGSRPLYKTGLVNGYAGALFDSTDDFFTVPNAFSGLTACEMFVVVKRTVDPAISAGKTGIYQFGTDGVNATHFIYTDGNIYDDFGSTARNSTGNPTLDMSTNFRLYNVVTTGTEWTSFIDGTQHFTNATNTVGFTTAPLLGKDARGTTFFFDGWLVEFFFYNAKLSAPNKTSVKSYIATKFGLTIA